jgi:hypothetical protein
VARPALEQLSNPVLQDAIGRQPDRVVHTLTFEELVHLGAKASRNSAAGSAPVMSDRPGSRYAFGYPLRQDDRIA